MAEIVQIDVARPDPEIIRRACELLEAGKLVGVPTETVYGIACAPEHIEALYCAKERERGKPIARLAASLEQVAALGADFGKDGRALASRYWPGPLTLVLDTPEGPTGFRVPDHNVPLALARAFGRPIALTSANKSGDADAADAQEAFHALEPTASDFRASPSSDDGSFQGLGNPVTLYLENFQTLEKSDEKVYPASGGVPSIGKEKPAATQLPSTVILCTAEGIKILREGAILKEDITRVIS